MLAGGSKEVHELPLVVLATARAEDAAKRPPSQAGRTNQLPRRTVRTFGRLEAGDLRGAATQRTAAVCRTRELSIPNRASRFGDVLRVGLQQRLGEELLVRGFAPVGQQDRPEYVIRLLRYRPGLGGDGWRCNAGDGAHHTLPRRQQGAEIV